MACECSNNQAGPCECCTKAPTQSHYVELWKRVLPPSYVDPIESETGGMGLDVVAGQAAIFACLSEAVETNQGAAYIRRWSGASKPWASGPTKARATLELSRLSGDGEFIVRARTACLAVALDSRGAKRVLGRFFVLADTVLADGQIGPVPLEVEAEFVGYAGNVAQGSIVEFEPVGSKTVDAEVLSENQLRLVPTVAGSDDFSDTVGRRFVLDGALLSQNQNVSRETISESGTEVIFTPALSNADVGELVKAKYVEFYDLGLRLAQPECAAGGVTGSLDALAQERGVGRSPAETDDQLSRRTEEIQDKISPTAIEKILECELGACGLQWSMDEVGDPNGLGFVLDYHALDAGSLEEEGYAHGALLVDTSTRYYVVTVWVPDAVQYGLGLNDGPYPNAMDALDAPPLDGFASATGLECVARAWDSLRLATEAGVRFEIRKATP